MKILDKFQCNLLPNLVIEERKKEPKKEEPMFSDSEGEIEEKNLSESERAFILAAESLMRYYTIIEPWTPETIHNEKKPEILEGDYLMGDNRLTICDFCVLSLFTDLIKVDDRNVTSWSLRLYYVMEKANLPKLWKYFERMIPLV